MECINLLIQYVNDARSARQAEYDECMRRNLANPYVKLVHDLREGPHVLVPEAFESHPKYRRHDLGRWMTFRDAFDYANLALPNEVCAIVNLDIFLDQMQDWSLLPKILQQKMVLCLSRTEFNGDGTSFRDPLLLRAAFCNSQDAWLFRSPINVGRCDFRVGTMGCDNAIAHRIKESGYLPVNAPQRFRVFHYDRARGKTLENQMEIYRQERTVEDLDSHPERAGQYLLPDFDMIKSVDELLRTLNASEMQRYSAICDVLNNFIKASAP